MTKKLLVKVEPDAAEVGILALFRHLTGREATAEEVEEMQIELAAARALREASAPPEPES